MGQRISSLQPVKADALEPSRNNLLDADLVIFVQALRGALRTSKGFAEVLEDLDGVIYCSHTAAWLH